MPEPQTGGTPGFPHRIRDVAAEQLACLRFYTRLPVPTLPFEAKHRPEPFGRALRWAPLAGAVVGLFGAAPLLAATALGLPASVAATLATLGVVLASGGLHEDGLADVADGFGGGTTAKRKLEIMRDSRIGSYGALAIGLSLLLRVSLVASLLERYGTDLACVALIAAAAASRGFGLLPLAVLPSARADGLAHAAGRLDLSVFPTAAALGAVLGFGLPALAGAAPCWPLLALLLSALAGAGLTSLAKRQIGGYTGDVAGAAQQCCEMAFLLGLLAAPGFS